MLLALQVILTGSDWGGSNNSLMIHHKVRDYEAWRPGYDEHEKSRAAAGITNGRVFGESRRPKMIW